MIPKKLEEIEAADLQLLLENRTPESASLDFKSALPRDEKTIDTVCAFANTGGGDLLIGAKEKGNFLSDLPGLEEPQIEKTKKWVEQLVRTGIDPPITTLRQREINLGSGRWVIIVRVERGWTGPHRRVQTGHFLGRHAEGNYTMSIEELRRAFTEGELFAEGVRRFREERVRRIFSRSGLPVPLGPNPWTILHLIPLSFSRARSQVDVHDAHKRVSGVTALRAQRLSPSYNLDGVVGRESGNSERANAYLQIFRFGALEAVQCSFKDKQHVPVTGYEGAIAPPEVQIVPALRGYIELLNALGVPWPVYALISVLRVGNYKLAVQEGIGGSIFHMGDPIKEDTVQLPEIELPRDPQEAIRVLRPVFDIFWQAFGQEKLEFFNEQNDYVRR